MDNDSSVFSFVEMVEVVAGDASFVALVGDISIVALSLAIDGEVLRTGSSTFSLVDDVAFDAKSSTFSFKIIKGAASFVEMVEVVAGDASFVALVGNSSIVALSLFTDGEVLATDSSTFSLVGNVAFDARSSTFSFKAIKGAATCAFSTVILVGSKTTSVLIFPPLKSFTAEAALLFSTVSPTVFPADSILL